jgi:hypothetical protein
MLVRDAENQMTRRWHWRQSGCKASASRPTLRMRQMIKSKPTRDNRSFLSSRACGKLDPTIERLVLRCIVGCNWPPAVTGGCDSTRGTLPHKGVGNCPARRSDRSLFCREPFEFGGRKLDLRPGTCRQRLTSCSSGRLCASSRALAGRKRWLWCGRAPQTQPNTLVAEVRLRGIGDGPDIGCVC